MNVKDYLENLPVNKNLDIYITLWGKIIDITKIYVRFKMNDLFFDIDVNDVEKIVYENNSSIPLPKEAVLYVRKGCRMLDIFDDIGSDKYVSQKKPFAISTRENSQCRLPRNNKFDQLNRKFLKSYGIDEPLTNLDE
jgi:hypothetical protein